MLAPGDEATVQIELFNQSAKGEQFTLRIVDLPSEMVLLSQNSVYVAPGERAKMPISLNVSEESRIKAGHHPYQIIVRCESDPEETAVVSARITVAPTSEFSMEVWPLEITGNGQCQILVRNEGNGTSRLSLVGQSNEPSLQFEGQRGQIKLEPGEATTLSMSVMSDDRPFFGRSRRHPFEIRVRNDMGEAKSQTGQLVLKPIVPSWALPVAEILLVVLLASLAISRFFGNDAQQVDNTPVMALESEDTNVPPIAETPVGDSSAAPSGETDNAEGAEIEATAVIDFALPDLSPAATDDAGTTSTENDSDGDGLSNLDEINVFNTDPNLADSDLDGVSDGDEIANGTDPLRFPISTATPAPDGSDVPPIEETAVIIVAPTSEPAPEATPAPQTQPSGDNGIQLSLVPEGTGWVSESGGIGTGLPAKAGDLADNDAVRGFLSYDLSAIPANATIASAQLNFPTNSQDITTSGAPFSELDCLMFESSEFELPLDESDYDAFGFFIECLPNKPTNLDLLIDVQDALDFDSPYLQIRFGFTADSNNDNAIDLFEIQTAPTLEVVYTS